MKNKLYYLILLFAFNLSAFSHEIGRLEPMLIAPVLFSLVFTQAGFVAEVGEEEMEQIPEAEFDRIVMYRAQLQRYLNEETFNAAINEQIEILRDWLFSLGIRALGDEIESPEALQEEIQNRFSQALLVVVGLAGAAGSYELANWLLLNSAFGGSEVEIAALRGALLQARDAAGIDMAEFALILDKLNVYGANIEL